MSRILVVGASKGIGLEVVKQALANGHSVRAFSRSARRIARSESRLEKWVGDALEPDDIEAALGGIDIVVQSLGVPVDSKLFLGPVNLFSRSTRLLVGAMQKKRVRRLIAVTGVGAGDSRASLGCLERVAFQLVLGRAYDDKDVQERLIRESDLEWVIVRPGILTNAPASRRYRVLTDPRHWRNGFVSRADVGDFIVKQIGSDRYLGKCPVLVR